MSHEILRSAGLRATKPRIRLLEVLQQTPYPLNVQEISDRLGKPLIDQVTVYRTLESFEKAGIVDQVDLNKGRAYFELARGHHHHVICRSCGQIEDVEGCAIESVTQDVARHSKNFSSITSHSLEFFGDCKTCSVK